MTKTKAQVGSFKEFRAGIYASLNDKVAERIKSERENISNALFAAAPENSKESKTQSNADEN